MNKYELIITPNAKRHIIEIYDYILNHLFDNNAAIRFLELLEDKMNDMILFPNSYPLVEIEPWKSMGIRKRIVSPFIIYFSIDSLNMVIYVLIVVYGKRDQFKQLNELDF